MINEKEIQNYYQDEKVTGKYDNFRFKKGGGLVVDETEKSAVLKLVGSEKKNILDVATGTGRFAAILAKKGNHVTGVDLSNEMLKIAKRTFEIENVSVKLVVGDATKLPFNDNSFDTVISMRLLIHIDDLDKFVREFARVSKKEVIFDTVNVWSLKAIQIVIANALSGLLGLSPVSMHSASEVERVAKRNGLKLKRRENTFFIPPAVYLFLPTFVSKGLKKIDSGVLKITGGRLASSHTWLFEKG